MKGWNHEGSVCGAGRVAGRGLGGNLSSDAGGRPSSMAGPGVLTRRESMSMLGNMSADTEGDGEEKRREERNQQKKKRKKPN